MCKYKYLLLVHIISEKYSYINGNIKKCYDKCPEEAPNYITDSNHKTIFVHNANKLYKNGNVFLDSKPDFIPPKPPIVRSDFRVLWHGIIIGTGFLESADPTAR